MNRILLVVLSFAILSGTVAQAQVTVAESSDYTRTSTYADVVSFLAALDGARVTHHTLGTSVEGREIPLVIIADPPVHEPSDLDGRVLVLAFGNIHAGEVCGKEALCMLARDLAGGDPILEHVAVAIVPIYNTDGNERFDEGNRPGQNGPQEMGIRHNAQDLDLNRDWMKADAPETRAMLRFYRTWDPHLVIDTHTTNGSKHRYTLTYQGPKHPSGDPELLTFVRDEMLPAITEDVRAKSGYETFFYGNFARDHTQWTTYPASPRYGTPYRGLRHRVAILSEAYSYATFRDRVLSTRAFCRSILDYAATNHERITKMCADASKDRPETIAIRTEAKAFEQKVTVFGY
ncbi:MAG: M14 family metallopeptidase, partial [Phycisphaerales bacterium]|nr:M14 family metallopeptidase [Phycisphaerales bacterium]